MSPLENVKTILQQLISAILLLLKELLVICYSNPSAVSTAATAQESILMDALLA